MKIFIFHEGVQMQVKCKLRYKLRATNYEINLESEFRHMIFE